ncbi:hypothetical protein CO172_03800 [Candidatus Uhrbacteria bacterium CG_4_9_14_3_um_filter_36_7]|uniref:Uncharacterized protein n=1 Tax=Candidatus Uhrbacteria bacterium CG_4_9_14_3_um_filter_36_7 TaxID=1975033 RepID=A0A2M7XES9_9BACT|nr:MAG: hypothetical protein CO172_03800 [Candidatus Uhrbacteria bacterium CG_4_9_14_3_um_filter_36_7]
MVYTLDFLGIFGKFRRSFCIVDWVDKKMEDNVKKAQKGLVDTVLEENVGVVFSVDGRWDYENGQYVVDGLVERNNPEANVKTCSTRIHFSGNSCLWIRIHKVVKRRRGVVIWASVKLDTGMAHAARPLVSRVRVTFASAFQSLIGGYEEYLPTE